MSGGCALQTLDADALQSAPSTAAELMPSANSTFGAAARNTKPTSLHNATLVLIKCMRHCRVYSST
jgi:hypothetical protein